MTHWANAYIGQRWTPEQDCWYWFRRIQSEVFFVDVPSIDVDPLNLRAMVRAFEGSGERANWIEVIEPVDGDAVLMSHRNQPHHIGVWVGDRPIGGVLHAVEGSGVVYSPRASLYINGWRIVGVYRHANHHP